MIFSLTMSGLLPKSRMNNDPDSNVSASPEGKELSDSGRWLNGTPPENVRIGERSIITGDLAFKRFHSEIEPALVIGGNCTMDGVHFDIGKSGRIEIGEYC